MATGSTWSHSSPYRRSHPGSQHVTPAKSGGAPSPNAVSSSAGRWRPKMRHLLDLDAVVERDLQERVLGDLAHHRHRDRSTADDVTHLTLMGMPTPIRTHVTHRHDIGARRVTYSFAFDHPGERVRRVRLPILGLATATFRGAAHPVGLRVEPVHERHPDVGRQREPATDHPELVAPMPDRPPTALLRVQPLDRDRPHPLIPRRVAQHTQTRAARHIQQPSLRARHRRLGPRDLPRLRDRHLTRHQRVTRLRTRLHRRHQRQRVARRERSTPTRSPTSHPRPRTRACDAPHPKQPAPRTALWPLHTR